MVIGELLRYVKDNLTDNAVFEAEEILSHTLNMSRTELILNSKEDVSREDENKVISLLKRRQEGEPLWYIIGKCEFMSLPFYVKKGVLIPRPDTETLVEEIIKTAKDNAEILDICCGSGCIGISLGKYIKGSKVKMLDISPRALEISQRNIELNGVGNVSAERLDILKEVPKGRYDIVVSNPPYINSNVIDTLQREVKDYEPRLALDGGSDGLIFYRRIADIAPLILKKGGILAFEIGYDQGESVKELMEKSFLNVDVIKDLQGNDRVVQGELV